MSYQPIQPIQLNVQPFQPKRFYSVFMFFISELDSDGWSMSTAPDHSEMIGADEPSGFGHNHQINPKNIQKTATLQNKRVTEKRVGLVIRKSLQIIFLYPTPKTL